MEENDEDLEGGLQDSENDETLEGGVHENNECEETSPTHTHLETIPEDSMITGETL